MVLLLTGKVTTELGIQNPAAKFFSVLVQQLHNVQNISERVHETKLHQGDWHDIGSVMSWTFTTEGKVETCKESIEAIDEANKTITFSLFDGEISKNYKMCRIIVQITDKKDAGHGVAIWTFDYEKLNEDVGPPYRYLDFLTAVTKDIDSHLLKA